MPPAELTCDENPSQEKCKPVEKSCDADPTQEKCNIFRKTCKEDINQEKCSDSIYGDIKTVSISMSDDNNIFLCAETIEQITDILNEINILEVEFVEKIAVESTTPNTSDYILISVTYEQIDDEKEFEYAYFQDFKISKSGKVESKIGNYCYYSSNGAMNYNDLYEYLDKNGEKRIAFPEFTMEDLDIVLAKLNSADLNNITSGSLSMSWSSKNNYLINYILDEINKIEFVEKLTKENKKDTALAPQIAFCYKENTTIGLYLAEPDYLYIVYTVAEDSIFRRAIKYQFRSEKITNSDFFLQFTGGKPAYGEYLKESVVYEYIDESILSKSKQESIIISFIEEIVDLSLYYKEGIRFSGSIVKYYGNYGTFDTNTNKDNSASVFMVKCPEISYLSIIEEETIDGVTFEYTDTNRIYCEFGGIYSLQEAFDYGYLTHADLVSISNKHNNG